MTEPLLTESDERKLIHDTKQWLGYSGILHFRDIVEVHGSIDSIWMEYTNIGDLNQFVPRSVYAQEAKHLRMFLKSHEISKDWTEDDFNNSWVWLIEKSIEEESE